MCRSRRELSNEYLLPKFGFDTAENEPYYFEISSSREFEFDFELTNRLFATQAALAIPLRGKTNGIAEVMRIRTFAAPLPASTLTFHTAPIAPRPSSATWLSFREPEAWALNSNPELCLFPFPVIFPFPHTARFRAIFPFPWGKRFSLNTFSSNFQNAY